MNNEQMIRQVDTLIDKLESLKVEWEEFRDQLEYGQDGCICGGADPDCSFHFPQDYEPEEETERCADCHITGNATALQFRDGRWWCQHHI